MTFPHPPTTRASFVEKGSKVLYEGVELTVSDRNPAGTIAQTKEGTVVRLRDNAYVQVTSTPKKDA